MNKRIGAFSCLVQSYPVYCNLGIIFTASVKGILSLDVVIQQYDLKQVIELKEHHFLTRLLSYALILLKLKPAPTSKPILTLYN